MTHGDELRTPAPGCPACEARRRHTAEERREFHPLSGHGYSREVGWTLTTLPPLAVEAKADDGKNL